MRANKFILDDIGGAFPIATNTKQSKKYSTASPDLLSAEDSDALDSLYASPVPPIPVKRHDAHSVKNRLKAKRLSETQLTHLSEQLSKLADEIRYLNPLMAETLDEAWNATEDAIEMLSDDNSGW